MTDSCRANGLLGHCGCWLDPDDGQCCWCTESNPTIYCTCTIQPFINLPEPVDAAHWWDPECPVHLTDPNDS